MSNSLDYFVMEPLRRKNLGLWKFRVAQKLHESTGGKFDEWYVRRARRGNPPQSLGAPQFIDDSAIDAAVAELGRDGCSILPRKLSDADIREISDFAFSTPAIGVDPSAPLLIDPANIPRNTARHVWSINQIIRIPAVQRLMLDPAFSSIAQNYLKATSLLTSVTLWIDAPADKKYGAHLYHYDNDGPAFLKFFFYLTDVEPDTGAHCYIKGTHGHQKPEIFRVSKVHEDETALLDFYGRDREVMFAAPKGTIIAEDTAGFHRGSTVTRAHRLLMQFQFAVLDIPTQEDLDGAIKPVAIPDLPPALQPVLAKFMVKA